MANPLETILAVDPPPFALLHRGGGDIDILTGTRQVAATLADIPRRPGRTHDVLALLPYRQISERGYPYPATDTTPLITLIIDHHATVSTQDLRQHLPDPPVTFTSTGFDLNDEQYAAKVAAILTDEIGTGAGANFVLRRTLHGDISPWSATTALALYARLLHQEPGAHWTFLIWTGQETLLGASPERHLTLHGGRVSMNPISGTLRFPAHSHPTREEVLAFLQDPKEANELYMVLDEELKMLGHICPLGGQVSGPHLKSMSNLAHTEYLIHGTTDWDPRDILRATMFAPTVIGGPLESATAVVARHEESPRGYYAGVAALLGTGEDQQPTLDSTILIRTATIDTEGHLSLSVGATLVRDSTPSHEAAETAAKAQGMLRLLQNPSPRLTPATAHWDLPHDPRIRAALQRRNRPIAPFWFDDPRRRSTAPSLLQGLNLLIIDGEDTFTEMAKHLIGSLGVNVTIRRHHQPIPLEENDLVILGPGPGDPTDLSDPKINRLRDLTDTLLATEQPFFAVCLGHQILATAIGLTVTPLPTPNQGVQRRISTNGHEELVGFYNTFAASPHPAGTALIARGHPVHADTFTQDGRTFIHGLRGHKFASVQYHPASVLTPNGLTLLANTLTDLANQAGLIRDDRQQQRGA